MLKHVKILLIIVFYSLGLCACSNTVLLPNLSSYWNMGDTSLNSPEVYLNKNESCLNAGADYVHENRGEFIEHPCYPYSSLPCYPTIADELPPDIMNSWIPPGISKMTKDKIFTRNLEYASERNRRLQEKRNSLRSKMAAEHANAARIERQQNESRLKANPPGAHKVEKLEPGKKKLSQKLGIPTITFPILEFKGS